MILSPLNGDRAETLGAGRVVLLGLTLGHVEALRRAGFQASLSPDEIASGDTAAVLFAESLDPSREGVARSCHTAGRAVKLVSLESLRDHLCVHRYDPVALQDFVVSLPTWEPPEPAREGVGPSPIRTSTALAKRPAGGVVAARSVAALAPTRRRGFTKVPNDLFEEQELSGLRAEQCHVVTTLLRVAIFEACLIPRSGGGPIPVPAGTVALSLHAIATEARTSAKVVRTTINKLLDRRWLDDIGKRLAPPLSKTSARLLQIANWDSYMEMRGPDERRATLQRLPPPKGQGLAAEEAETRSEAVRLAEQLAQMTGRPVNDIVREHSRTKKGSALSGLPSLRRASISWVVPTRDRLLASVEEARRSAPPTSIKQEMPWEKAERRAREEEQ